MYDEYYGLNDKPFQLTPDPRFYFESATHRKAMAYLGYGLAQGEGFIVITGEIGAGKTTLVGHLMATIDPSRVKALSIVSTQVEGDDVLRLVANGIGIDTTGADKALLLSRIDMTLQERVKTGQRTLLIVDEAQNLPTSALEELRMLSNFQSGSSAMLQILLLGQPEFRERLNTAPELEQLRQRVIATHHLTAMEPEEVGPYLGHRLKLVGWNGRPQFTEESIAALQQHSGGLPRKLNTLASRVLLLGAVEHRAVIDEDNVAAVVADLARDAGLEPADIPASLSSTVEKSDGPDLELPVAAPEPVAQISQPEASVEIEAVKPETAPQVAEPVAAFSREPEPAAPAAKPVEASEPLDLASFRPAMAAPQAYVAPNIEPEMTPAQSVEPPAKMMPDATVLDLQARVAMLEAQVEEQDAALRRVLGLLVEWVENEEKSPASHIAAA